MKKRKPPTIAAIRRAVADFVASQGCGCCSNMDKHDAHAETLGALLRVPKYADGSGRDFYRFKTKDVPHAPAR
jgi:methionine aminopeptidase